MHDKSDFNRQSCLWNAVEETLMSMFLPSVYLRILQNVPDLETLENARLINKKFYSVYKANGLHLIKGRILKMSPPAWELREMGVLWADPFTLEYMRNLTTTEKSIPDTTPVNYLYHYAYEMYVIARLTAIVFMPEEKKQIIHDGQSLAAINDAFWRIWTFCRVFGSGKNREYDWEGQQDWMAGGPYAHRPSGCRVSGWGGNSEVLSLPPSSFGKGNYNGLSACQVQIMQYIWNLLQRTLRQNIQGHLAGQTSSEWERSVIGMVTNDLLLNHSMLTIESL
jgi:hypothetical protein